MKELPNVQIGQIWADTDPRQRGRQLRVLETGIIEQDNEYVKLEVIKARDEATVSNVGAKKKVLRRRMRPAGTGYKLIGQ